MLPPLENITVTYDPHVIPIMNRIFGRVISDDEIATLAGAIDGSFVRVEGRSPDLSVRLHHKDVERHELNIGINNYNERYIRIDNTVLKTRGEKIGLKQLCRIVDQAKKFDFTYIELEAEGDFQNSDRMNGYYVWAKYGFNARLEIYEQQQLPEELRFISAQGRTKPVETLNELMLIGGQDWWRIHGKEKYMVFDLSENSISNQILTKLRDIAGWS